MFFRDAVDVSLDRHSTSAIVKQPEKSMESIPNLIVNSIITDSASSCAKARRALTDAGQYEHVIEHRCQAHVLNNVGNHFSGSSGIS